MTIDQILERNPRAIARAATAIENRESGSLELLKQLFPYTGKALTVGITGPPGAGKSTLAAQLTSRLRHRGQTVGVLAIDPSSPFTGGAILGDRIRMMGHHADEGVFVRSMATRGQLGGVAAATSDLSLLLDAAGYDVVLIETVGVGQDEVDVVRIADVTCVVLFPGAGDEVQAIKAGILEIADVFVLNKADQPGIEKLVRELELIVPNSRYLVRCTASEGKGVDDALNAIREFAASGTPARRAAMNWSVRLKEMFRERIAARITGEELDRAAESVAARATDPYTVIDSWLSIHNAD